MNLLLNKMVPVNIIVLLWYTPWFPQQLQKMGMVNIPIFQSHRKVMLLGQQDTTIK